MMFARQLGNELLKMFARKRTYIGFGAFGLLQLVILVMLQMPRPRERFERRLQQFGGLFEEYFGGLTLGVMMILFSFFTLGVVYIALVAGDIVSKEVEDGTLRMTLCRPVSRVRVLAVKWVSCQVYTVALIVFLCATALVGATMWRGGLGKMFVFYPPEDIRAGFDTAEGIGRFATATGMLCVSASVIAGVGFLFSCMKAKPAAAAILTVSVFFIDAVLRNIPDFEPYERWFLTYHVRSWMLAFEPATPWGSIAWSWGYLAVVHVVCAAVGMWVFGRRDIKT